MKHLLATAVLLGLSPVAGATEISVSLGPDFTEKLTEDYGAREGEYLAERVRTDLQRAIDRSGADVARVDVTILDAKPSRPTFKQAGDRPGLDMHRSVSLGGMKLKAVAYDATGTLTDEFEYKWYESDIQQAGITTWQDARRASSRFATRFVKQID